MAHPGGSVVPASSNHRGDRFAITQTEAGQPGHHSSGHRARSLTSRLHDSHHHPSQNAATASVLIVVHPRCTLRTLPNSPLRRAPLRKNAELQGSFPSGRSRTRTWDLFLIREAL